MFHCIERIDFVHTPKVSVDDLVISLLPLSWHIMHAFYREM
jgi:hypothetical protein